MQFMTLLCRVSERFSDADFAPLLEREVEQAKALYADGFIRQIWHRADVGGACLLIEAESEDAVRQTLATLPLVAEGMLEIVALVPLTPYAGFGPGPVAAEGANAPLGERARVRRQ